MSAALTQLGQLVLRILKINPGEGKKTAIMFGIMMCTVGTFITGRIARDSLFLSRYSVDFLPVLYIWVAVGVTIQSYLYSRIADRFRRDKLFKATLLVLAGVFLIARLALYWAGDWFFPVLYVLVELVGSMLIIQSWTIANEVFNTREAKRLFGLVGAGGVVSSVVAGFGVRASVQWIGTENLLYLCAAGLVLAFFLVVRLSDECKEEFLATITMVRREIRQRIALIPDFKRIFSKRHLVFVAALVSILVFVMTYVDWQFKIMARYAYLNRETELAGFFGMFYGLTGILNIFIQAIATSRILEKFGVLVSLLMLPIALLTGAVSWLILPALWSASLLKGADATLRYTVNDATMQLLYLPVPSYLRGRAKAFIDGIIRPISIGLAGISLAWILPHLPPQAFGILLLVLLTAWIGITFAVVREYLASLLATLRSRRLDFDMDSNLVPDQAAAKALKKALDDSNVQNVLHALEMIPYTTSRIDWGDSLVKLTRNSNATIRAKAVRLLGELGSLQHGPVVYSCLRDPNPSVLAAAITSYCAIGKDRAVRTISLFLKHDDIVVRSAAVVGLIRYGGLDGVLSSAEKLKEMLGSDKPQERASGARILGEIQVKNFYHPLLELMTDHSKEVQTAAIWAAGRMKSPELLPALVYRIESPDTRAAAVEALSAIGTPSVKLLKRVMNNTSESLSTREVIPLILSRIGDQPSIDALQGQLAAPETRLRTRVLDAMHKLRLRKPHLKLDNTIVQKAFESELRTLYENCFIEQDLDAVAGSLLADACRERKTRSTDRLFKLLSCMYPVKAIDAVYANLSSQVPRARANALEVLDTMLDKNHKRSLMPVLDPNQRSELDEIGQEVFELKHQSRIQRVATLIRDPDTWISACAIFEAGMLTEHKLAEEILSKTVSDDPLLRETALVSLAKLLPKNKFVATAKRHLKDPSIQVRTIAKWLYSSTQPV